MASPAPILLLALAVAAVVLKSSSDGGEPSSATGLPPIGTLDGVDYIVREVGGATQGDGSPVVIAFHGLGATPELMGNLLESAPIAAHVVLPTGKNSYGKNHAWWTERAAADDQQLLGEQMTWAADDISPFIRSVRRAYGRRPVLFGHSQGGMMTALLAQRDLGAAAVIAGSSWVPESIQSAPVVETHFIHGDGDTTIPFDRTQAWVQSMIAGGAPVKWHPVDAEHGISGELRAELMSTLESTVAR